MSSVELDEFGGGVGGPGMVTSGGGKDKSNDDDDGKSQVHSYSATTSYRGGKGHTRNPPHSSSIRRVMSSIGPGRRAPDTYVVPEEKPPTRAIWRAVLMLLAGTFLIGLGVLLLTGIIPTFYWRRGWSLCFIGSLLFIPGSYYSYVAYGAWMGYKGYRYSLIPDVD
ncbi:UPF0414 transmembrane protein C20orf30 [Thecamonas trahens ATCC 50062]|uniref:Transmembrane protein 230 n=1 Tax=Thecamonas trahens ATCC 50062 TaxID=461836 RepID=A0A0L0DEC2_THETB|nr:UPF0414 transmembrane protein C20orf30 [Thecamonas trahens ATCC 50062]KNC50511.1 UPF0414 transmembrane protein C20orf30 [Thecamonas trahens ATCC 50062]|eukprot:XP_013762403.1 UPF0414 transmembrane protein C20orf30 [Thecamonas trahens ATCC 50062]